MLSFRGRAKREPDREHRDSGFGATRPPGMTDINQIPMDAREVIKIGMSAERRLVVPAERTVGHFVPDMPMVYATPMMILEMEMASADAIAAQLQPGWVTVGTEVDIRHLAATPVGSQVRTTAKVIAVERRLIRFEVEAFDREPPDRRGPSCPRPGRCRELHQALRARVNGSPPHPEERRLRRVSKELEIPPRGPSFETPRETRGSSG